MFPVLSGSKTVVLRDQHFKGIQTELNKLSKHFYWNWSQLWNSKCTFSCFTNNLSMLICIITNLRAYLDFGDIFSIFLRESSDPLSLKTDDICHKSPDRNERKRQLCKQKPEILEEVLHGVEMSLVECQQQMKRRKWNCTTENKNMKKLMKTSKNVFLYLIFSITHSLSLSRPLSHFFTLFAGFIFCNLFFYAICVSCWRNMS